MQISGTKPAKFLLTSKLLYLLFIAFSFYSLILSRSGEARTVWEVLHPVFIPSLVIATFLLLTILLASEKVSNKLLLIIIYSILIHSLFSIIFPVGDLSGQQMILGRTRLVYDNAVLHGWPPWQVLTIQSRVYEWIRGINFQAALSVVFARMFSIDILWVHLFLVPVLWGVFTPIAAYLITYTFTENEKVAVLASLLLSVFPYTVYFGAVSLPNSLGFIFFFYALYFMIKDLGSSNSKAKFLMLAFSFFSLLSHYLTGVMSLSFLVLILAFKSHIREKKTDSAFTRLSLATAFIVSISLLPLSLIYLRVFRPETQTAFTLDKFSAFPLEEIFGLLLIGELTYGFDLKTILTMISGPLLAFLCMIYLLFKSRRNPKEEFRTRIYFLFAAFLVILVDYRILKLFMEGVPFNEERLWALRDFIAASFVALAVYGLFSVVKSSLKVRFPLNTSFANIRALSKGEVTRILALLLVLDVFFPVILTGWIASSIGVAYPHVAPLQTTWYEIEAVKYIEENTPERYVVIGDVWTIYAGEVIVGLNNPRAYYFLEFNKTGYDLFVNMKQNPSPQWMIQAMNITNTTSAFFIVTEPRLGTVEFNSVVSRALQNEQMKVAGVFGDGKLYVFSYRQG